MTELVNIKKGEGKLQLKVVDGKVMLILFYDGKHADAKLEVSLEVDEYLEMLKEAIPGSIDDAVIDMLKVAMK